MLLLWAWKQNAREKSWKTVRKYPWKLFFLLIQSVEDKKWKLKLSYFVLILVCLSKLFPRIFSVYTKVLAKILKTLLAFIILDNQNWNILGDPLGNWASNVHFAFRFWLRLCPLVQPGTKGLIYNFELMEVTVLSARGRTLSNKNDPPILPIFNGAKQVF